MILLFGNHTSKNNSLTKTSSSNKTNTKNNNPVENSGILASSLSDIKAHMTMGEYDTFISSNPVAINYAMYSDFSEGSTTDFCDGFLSDFSTLVDGGFGGDCGFSASCGDSCGSSFAVAC